GNDCSMLAVTRTYEIADRQMVHFMLHVINQLVHIATGQIRSANAASKKHIPANNQFIFMTNKNDVSWGMTGYKKYFQQSISKPYCITLIKKHGWFRRRNKTLNPIKLSRFFCHSKCGQISLVHFKSKIPILMNIKISKNMV